SISGIGINALASAATGTTTGLLARVNSAAGTAAVFRNAAGGKILSGLVGIGNGVEKFSVDGSGNVTSSGSVTATSFIGSGSGLTNVLHAIEADSAVNAQTLGGVAAANFARRDIGNSFAGSQVISGVVTATTFLGDGSGLTGIASGTGGVENTGSTTIGADTDSNGVGEIALQTRQVTRVVVKNDGKVGIGTASPATLLDVSGIGSFSGTTTAENTAILTVVQNGGEDIEPSPTAPPPPAAIVGAVTSPSAFAVGILGVNSSPNGLAVVGYNSATTGGIPAVAGITNSSAGDGVDGIALATSGDTRGVHGEVYSPDGTAGKFDSRGGGWVIRGGNDTTDVFTVDSSGNTWMSGNLSKAGGSFKIDHPVDPADKYLSHSFVESPDMMNIYNGVTRLDAKGEAWVALPEWFEALNSDFRYQLTAIGRPQPRLYIAQEISANRFKIAGGKSGAKVSWQVTGIRQDAYARAHRIQVEEEKPAAAKGFYLHPELFGQPATRGIQWAGRADEAKPRQKEVQKSLATTARGGN
ncbi:MAG: hypothetical protein ABSA70_04565, partial [Terriglobia bacterium]